MGLNLLLQDRCTANTFFLEHISSRNANRDSFSCLALAAINAVGIFKDVRFYPVLNFGHFGAPLAIDLPQCQEP